MATVLTFTGKPVRRVPGPARVPQLRPGAEVYLCQAQSGGWLLVDVSASGDSAGMYGTFATYEEGEPVARALAYRIGATFYEREGVGCP